MHVHPPDHLVTHGVVVDVHESPPVRRERWAEVARPMRSAEIHDPSPIRIADLDGAFEWTAVVPTRERDLGPVRRPSRIPGITHHSSQARAISLDRLDDDAIRPEGDPTVLATERGVRDHGAEEDAAGECRNGGC